MSPRERSFWWKIGYLVAIVALLAALAWLGQPASGEAEGGGKLAQLRNEYELDQKHLGQIDATSETIKLATLGLRPVAANLLWGKAHLYKKKKDWTNLEATVNQITSLQPNFIEVWKFQGWNLSYNVSVEFDDYRDRYHFVIEGINFLRKGIRYNQHEPILPWEVGWAVSQKIGRSDEHRQFRRLFQADDDFHASLPFEVQAVDRRDNWLVGKEWYRIVTDMVDTEDVVVRGKSPRIYRSSGPMCQINYADARGKEGRFGDVTQEAWRQAAREWEQYGAIDLPTYHLLADGQPIMIQLNDLDRGGRNYLAQIERDEQELDSLEPGLREKIREERRAKLTDEQRRALEIPPHERTGSQHAVASGAEEQITVSNEDLAKRISDRKQRARAVELWREIREAEAMATIIRRDREIVNFDYWRLRTEVEQLDEAVAANEYVYLARQAMENAELNPAKEDFRKGMAAWRNVLDEKPEALASEGFGEDLLEVVEDYRKLLGKRDDRDDRQQRDATFGKDVPLFDVDAQFREELDRATISEELRREFQEHEIHLSDDASVSTEVEGSKWTILDGPDAYEVRKEEDGLNVLRGFILADIVRLYERQPAAGQN